MTHKRGRYYWLTQFSIQSLAITILSISVCYHAGFALLLVPTVFVAIMAARGAAESDELIQAAKIAERTHQ